jgi:uncharacterized protein (TIGR04255 family)
MTSRPPNLPDFTTPPVSESVLGVQFDTLERFLAPHLGLVWTEFRDQFPDVEEHPPLEPVFETFAEGGPSLPMPGFQLQFVVKPPTPRVFLINRAKTELLQVQRDRFLHNWRKMQEPDIYPRFEQRLETFEAGYRRLEQLVAREQLGAIVPNQCEIAYINQIVRPDEMTAFEVYERLFGSFTKSLVLPELEKPEDARFMFRFVIRGSTGAPVGRLIVTAEPAWRADGTSIIQLTLLARGKPSSSDLAGVKDFLTIGRNHVVKTFANLTSEEMHREWGRTQ